jgi:cytochrome b6-f complex iron-sulfur subunit
MMTDTEKTPSGQKPKPSVFTSRRQFIALGLATLGAAWAGTFVQSKLFPQPTAQEAKPVEFSLTELPVGGVKAITYAGAPAIVLRTPVGIRALSLVCTHMGCVVQWQAADKSFYCPCHGGRFDQFGDVTGGPPPVSLEQFPVTVDGDRVIVGEST